MEEPLTERCKAEHKRGHINDCVLERVTSPAHKNEEPQNMVKYSNK